MKCIVCHSKLTKAEYDELAPEFKPHPVHKECFDTFVNADEFLEFASEQTSSKKFSPPPATQAPPPDLSPN